LGLDCYAVITHPDELVLEPPTPKKILDPLMGYPNLNRIWTLKFYNISDWDRDSKILKQARCRKMWLQLPLQCVRGYIVISMWQKFLTHNDKRERSL